ncbi:MAG: tRNA threonylcarbamoyladenosine dehydratase [Clostridia bacterium]|nr:tRNA threonylcarbamoyladenosine dehydratase [Clostridia bacterium]
MKEQFIRTAGLIGEAAIARLQSAHVAVFGIGGVGGYAVEALVRAGVGALDLIDNDTVSESNLNRQIIALHSTVGQYKTEVAANRARDINPNVKITVHNTFFLPENADRFDFSRYDYVIDAIDTVAAKMELVRRANATGTPIISAMGTGNKLDPTAFRVSDIYKTEGCPLARTVRGLCRKEGIKNLKVVWSPEPPCGTTFTEGSRHAPASISFVPAAAGLVLAGAVIKDLCSIK